MNNIMKAKEWLQHADAILIGASNGLSIAEEYHIFANNEMFRRQFGDYQQRFGIMNVIQGCFFDYPADHDRNEFFRRLVAYWITDYKPSQIMKDLRAIVGNKPYFIITSNGDMHLELSGFDPKRVFEIEGTFLNAFGSIDDKSAQLHAFIKQFSEESEINKLVILELGVGMHNTLIKRPLMQLAAQLPTSNYVTLNLERELYIPDEIADRSLGLAGDIGETLKMLNNPEGHHATDH